MITRDEIINEMHKTYEEKGGGLSTNKKDLNDVENVLMNFIKGPGISDARLENCFSQKLGMATSLLFLKINEEDFLIHSNYTMTDKGIEYNDDHIQINLTNQDITKEEIRDYFKNSMGEFLKQSDSLKYMPVSSMKN